MIPDGALQIQPEILRLLGASQTYFVRAGRWRTAQLIIIVLLPTVLACYGAFQSQQIFVIPFVGFFAAVLDATLFNYVISQSRYRAAQLADMYDARVVSASPSKVRTVDAPSPEVIFQAAEAYFSKPGARERAERWYTERLAELKFPAAEMLCQRISVVSDERLRSRYITILLGIAVFGMIVLLFAAGLLGWDVKILMSNVLFPLVPAAAWLGREIVEQNVALQRESRLRTLLDATLWTLQIREGGPEAMLDREREALHGTQLMFRSRHPSVAWWLYRFYQESERKTMSHTTDTYVNDALASGHGSRFAAQSDSTYTER